MKIPPEYRNLIIFSLVVIIAIVINFISLRSRDSKIERLENELHRVKLSQDTMSASNRIYIETMRQTIIIMDSIYNLSQNSNESKIIEKWDSIRNSLITNPNHAEMSEWLSQFAKR
jgi:hypothetical protein